MKLSYSILILVTSMFVSLTSALAEKIEPTYEVVLVDQRWPDRPFVVKVSPKNERGIETLKSFLDNLEEVQVGEKARVSIGVPLGKVIKVVPSKEHSWSFAIDPETVVFYEYTIELCDASFIHIEQDVDRWMENIGQFCPWSAGYWFQKAQVSWSRGR